jgi:cytochrome c oxidase subunit 1
MFSPGQYLTVVGLHGSMMVMMVSSIILGPFGHYLVPIMIGAKRMAFPRMESLSFWLTPLSGLVLLTTMQYGGFPTGWTGYPSLANQADVGMDGYIFAFALIAVAMILNAVNMIATILNHRAPGLTWNRMPIFVWSMLTTSVLMLLGPPMLIAGLLMEALDRVASTTFFLAPSGGSPFLFENLFWFFGHPEVYILALPGFGIRPAAVLHADDRADLGADRLHLHRRDGNALAGQDPVHGADALLAGVLLQLPDRRHLGRVPVGRAV